MGGVGVGFLVVLREKRKPVEILSKFERTLLSPRNPCPERRKLTTLNFVRRRLAN